jgi:hypothetical protein
VWLHGHALDTPAGKKRPRAKVRSQTTLSDSRLAMKHHALALPGLRHAEALVEQCYLRLTADERKVHSRRARVREPFANAATEKGRRQYRRVSLGANLRYVPVEELECLCFCSSHGMDFSKRERRYLVEWDDCQTCTCAALDHLPIIRSPRTGDLRQHRIG